MASVCGTSSSHIGTPESNSHNFSIPFTLKETMDVTPTNGKKLHSLLRCKSNRDATTNSNLPNGCKNAVFKKPTSNGSGSGAGSASASASASASTSTWVCRNLACKNDVTLEESFCKRCSCCICHQFDDNKDPSLWLVCSSEVGGTENDFCGASCHVDCAIQQGRVGSVSIGDALSIDGSYCCAYCGKVFGILGFWRRQLEKAKEARRVDNLCQRIYIAFRLLDGTQQFKELHHIVADAYEKLETEVGPLDGVSAKMARSIVSRLPVSGDVQRLCSLGVEKVDQLFHSPEQDHPEFRDSLPAACKFKFEHITSSSMVIILKETTSTLSESVKGYKFWHWKSRDQNFTRYPHILQKSERKISIHNLEPCTEYCFRIISVTEEGDMGHSESRCFTGSIEIIINPARPRLHANGDSSNRSYRSTGFKIRNVGRVLRRAWAEEGIFWGCFPTNEEETADTDKDSCGDEAEKPQANSARRCRHSVSRRLDLNATIVPDLNVEAVAGPEDSGDSHTCRENKMETETETESGLGGQVGPASGLLNEDYEYCVKVVRWLECSGYIDKGFRMRFLTWFSLGSSEQERRIVLTFISTLIDEPSSLACQLEDSFMEIVSCKKPHHELCTKLWH